MTLKDFIPVFSGLIVVIIGSLIQFILVSRQLKASALIHISANRQEWINSLRNTISEFLAIANWLDANPYDKEKDDSQRQENIQKAYRFFSKIELHLNPNEADHTQLVLLNSEVMTLLKSPNYDSDKLYALFTAILDQSKKIIKDEWERVKQLY